MIEVVAATKVYGKKANVFTALKDVNFTIPTGASVAIVGKSGSGKSTLMHVMSGLDRLSSGQIMVNGKSLSSLKRKEMDRFRAQDMAFIFQAFFVEPNETCYQNVALPLEINEVPIRRRKKLVRQALERVELADKINQRAKNLSGGQKQRLAIARAIVNEPSIIFADEPTGNLDSATGDKIVSLLFALNKKMNSTLIIVTHDEDLAARCQIQITLKDGQVAGIRRSGQSPSNASPAHRPPQRPGPGRPGHQVTKRRVVM
jgi:putative ABC transport system ATP-binding protein